MALLTTAATVERILRELPSETKDKIVRAGGVDKHVSLYTYCPKPQHNPAIHTRSISGLDEQPLVFWQRCFHALGHDKDPSSVCVCFLYVCMVFEQSMSTHMCGVMQEPNSKSWDDRCQDVIENYIQNGICHKFSTCTDEDLQKRYGTELHFCCLYKSSCQWHSCCPALRRRPSLASEEMIPRLL